MLADASARIGTLATPLSLQSERHDVRRRSECRIARALRRLRSKGPFVLPPEPVRAPPLQSVTSGVECVESCRGSAGEVVVARV